MKDEEALEKVRKAYEEQVPAKEKAEEYYAFFRQDTLELVLTAPTAEQGAERLVELRRTQQIPACFFYSPLSEKMPKPIVRGHTGPPMLYHLRRVAA